MARNTFIWEKLALIVLSASAISIITTIVVFISYQDETWGIRIIDGSGNQTNLPRTKGAVSSFGKQWPEMRQVLCPDMTPNPNVWSALFELARMELGFAEGHIKVTGDDAGSVANFFTFHTGGSGYSYWVKGTKHHMAYLTVWKG